MTRVMLIADDMTGALDAGACLLPADVIVATSPKGAEPLLAEVRPAVLCVNAETRHLDALPAAERVASLVGRARREGVRCVVKKTDSALRGNIGAELAAAWRASGCERLHFIPALPEMGRVTRGGVHYVDGVPVSEGRFGKDPFEPVACSNVSRLIGLQTDVPVTAVSEGEPVPGEARGIVVYDATSLDRMLARVRELEEGGELGVIAGCSGVMRALARVLDLRPRLERGLPSSGNLLVVCGSVNGTSRGQCAYAASRGAAILPIAEREKCDDSWLESDSGRDFVSRAARSWATAPLTVIDGSGLEDLTRLVPDGAEVRQVVADHIGALLVRICESGAGGRVLVTGGDILASFLAQAHADRLRPLGQPVPGIVCFELEMAGGEVAVASKSGGFGSRSLFVDMAGLPKEEAKECAHA